MSLTTKNILFLLLMCLFNQIGIAQDAPVNSIFITQEAGTGFTVLNWSESLEVDFSIKRKTLAEDEWTVLNNSFNATQFVDTDSEPGTAYEYQIASFGPEIGFENEGQYTNIYAGHEIPSPTYRGRLLLLVEDNIADALTDKIERWKKDVIGDGWAVKQINVSQDSPIREIRDIVIEEYHHPDGLESLFLLGRITIPINAVLSPPDGHSEHNYWGADSFYGGLSTTWKPIGGGFGGEYIDSLQELGSTYQESELEIGRLDFHNMPAFSESEVELYQQYFDKNHAFRNKHFTPKMQAVIQENFNSGYDRAARRDFAVLLGTDSVKYEGYRDSLLNDSYIWSFGSGSGSYTGASGISNTNQMTTDSLQGIFTMLFGSYFGDWRTDNNFLRSSLGSGSILTACWGARPGWTYFHRGLGTNIGLQAKLSQSDDGDYIIWQSSSSNPNGGMDTFLVGSRYAREGHINLLGDPTLRMHTVHPVSEVTTEFSGMGVTISWQEPEVSTDIIRYNIYRKYETDLAFTKIGFVPVGSTVFTDSNIPILGEIEYLVKAEKLEETNSGSYYNESTGKTATISATDLDATIDEDNDGFPIGIDCDDTDNQINSSAIEIPYNGIDDDCNVATPDDDLDNDGYTLEQDCDDQNNQIYPGAIEISGNGIDENCNGSDELNEDCLTYDGAVDEDYLYTSLFNCDVLQESYHSFLVYPNQAFESLFTPTETGFRIDICNGYDLVKWPMSISVFQYSDFDNAPNGYLGELIATTEGCSLDFIAEPEAPFYLNTLIVIRDASDCNGGQNNISNGLFTITCIPKDNDEDGFDFNVDCDDDNNAVNPNATEIAYNGIDDDCNPATLDDDLDQDGFVLAEDCDDNNAAINPDATEIANNGIDENCDGMDLISSTTEVGDLVFSVHPNPTSRFLYIESTAVSNFQLRLFDVLGREIRIDRNASTLDLQQLANGVYWLEITDVNTQMRGVQKIILEK